jgi:hypothetical protein
VKFDPPYKMWLFVTMRAILDSKFAEHKFANFLDSRGITNMTRFPGKN